MSYNYKEQIKNIATKRAIPYLVHFTHVNNLASILNKGLLPRKKLHDENHSFYYNDELRLDGRPEASSLSISHPNEKMFYKYRINGFENDWVVLVIKPEVLWEKEVAFCKHNAACSLMTNASLASLANPAAFEGMFSGQREGYLKSHDTSDVQAEVLVFDTIEPSYIKGVVFLDQSSAQKHFDTLYKYNKGFITNKEKGFFKKREYLY